MDQTSTNRNALDRSKNAGNLDSSAQVQARASLRRDGKFSLRRTTTQRYAYRGEDSLDHGANRGIGQALVKEVLNRGAKRVFAGTRRALPNTDPRVREGQLLVNHLEGDKLTCRRFLY
jgi:hypothetical protein